MSALGPRLVAALLVSVLFGTPISASVCAGLCVSPSPVAAKAATPDPHCASAAQATGEEEGSAQIIPAHGASCGTSTMTVGTAKIAIRQAAAGEGLVGPPTALVEVPGPAIDRHRRAASPPLHRRGSPAAPLPLRI